MIGERRPDTHHITDEQLERRVLSCIALGHSLSSWRRVDGPNTYKQYDPRVEVVAKDARGILTSF